MAEVLANRLKSALGLTPPSPSPTPTGKVFVRRVWVKAEVSIPASQAEDSSLNISFTIDPKVGSVTSYTIPKGETWTLVDAFIKDASDVGTDGIAKLKKNFFTDWVVTPNVSTLLVSNPTRPAIARKSWNEGDTLSGEFVNTVAGGSSATTTVFYLVFDIYK